MFNCYPCFYGQSLKSKGKLAIFVIIKPPLLTTQAIFLTSYPFHLSSSYTEPLHLLLVDDDFAYPWAFHEQLLLPKTVCSSSSLPSLLFWKPSPSCLTQAKCASSLLPQHSKFSPVIALITLHYSVLINYLPPHPRYRPMRARTPSFMFLLLCLAPAKCSFQC